jgi:hypothetical protein
MNGSFICFGIFVMVCNPLHNTQRPPGVVNSWCSVYQRILRNEEEAQQVGRIESRAVRERIAYNETLYRCYCDNEFTHAICRNEAHQAEQQVRASMFAR